jgi:hypothetical protein
LFQVVILTFVLGRHSDSERSRRGRISVFVVALASLVVALAFLVVVLAFLVVIPEGDLLWLLSLQFAAAFHCTQENVISTEASDSLIVWCAVERPPYSVFALAFAFLVVIPEGDLLLSLSLQFAAAFSFHTRNVISTEASDSLIVWCAVERPPYSVFAFAFAVLVVIPEGDLLLSLSLLLASDHLAHDRKETPTHHNSPRKAHHQTRA